MLLDVKNVAKSYGDNQVLNGVTLLVDEGQKLGLVGANGVGKSTLLKIITGDEEPDGGHVWLHSGADVGYLPQVLSTAAGQTVEQLIHVSLGELQQMEARLRTLESEMAGGSDNLDRLMVEYGEISQRFEQRGGYDLEYRIGQVFAGLKIDHIGHDRPVDTLSGGEKERVGLAALLLRAPDLLLLDEPTNHLDFSALAWLEAYLQTYQGGVLVVSHDRHFLNQTVEAIVEIVEHSRETRHYSGGYEFYAQAKAEQRAQWEEEYARQQEEIWALRKAIKGRARRVAHNRPPRDNEKYAYTHKGERVQDAVSRNVRAAEEKLRRIEEDPIPRPPKEIRINPDFDPQSLTSRAPMSLEKIAKSYAGHAVLAEIDLALTASARVVIVGPNGAGKSTLLRIMAGVELPDHGTVYVSPSVVIGYLDQEQETLAMEGTAFEAYQAGVAGDAETLKTEILGDGLFIYEDLLKPVAALSVGQKRKLQLARLIAMHANLLLLDEPTNHVSLDVVEQFEDALLAFPGPVVAVSHDRHFIQRFASEVWEMKGGSIKRYLGGWEEYLEARKTEEGMMVHVT